MNRQSNKEINAYILHSKMSTDTAENEPRFANVMTKLVATFVQYQPLFKACSQRCWKVEVTHSIRLGSVPNFRYGA